MPNENPNGWLRPKQAKPMFRALPVGTVGAMIETEAGICIAKAMPCKARNKTR